MLNPSRSGQLSGHVHTLQIRSELGSALEALQSGRYLSSLYDTLQAWGIGVRGSRLVSPSDFETALHDHETDIAALDGLQIDDPNLDVTAVTYALWSLISTLGIVANDTPLVAGSKALHHVLPDLVVPIDRQYTRPFFGWNGVQFQYQQQRVFEDMFPTFHRIAVAVHPEQFLGKGWRTARTKIIDNGIVAFCLVEDVHRA